MEDKTFQLIEKMYIEFNKKFESMDKRFESMDKRFESMDKRFESMDKRFESIEGRLDNIENEVRKTNARIEHDIMPKIEALFDGYKQHTDQLERIEIAVSRHEDIIIRKIK